MFLDQSRFEAVMACRNGRMSGKNDFARNARDGGVEIQSFLFHAAADRFKDGKSAVSFVQMKHAGRDAHGLQSAEAAHAQKQFLTDSKPAIAAIEARRELPIFWCVSFDIGIEQEQGATPYFQPPDFCANRAAASLNLHSDGFAFLPNSRLHGHLADVRLEVLFLLPPVFV